MAVGPRRAVPLQFYARTFFNEFILVTFEIFPKWKCAALEWPCRINWTASLEAVKKDALHALFPHSFFDGEAVVNAIEILWDEINGVGLQRPAYSQNIIVVNPNITGLSAATVARATLTGTGVKAKVKPFILYNVHWGHFIYPFSRLNSWGAFANRHQW